MTTAVGKAAVADAYLGVTVSLFLAHQPGSLKVKVQTLHRMLL